MCSGSFMMKERFDTKVDLAGKENCPIVVGTVVEWKTETGATHEILCTSAIVAWIFQGGGSLEVICHLNVRGHDKGHR